MAEERAHALLSASGAHRWLVCTPSARLEAEQPETTSEYAEEGTTAHNLAELRLRQALDGKRRTTPKRIKESLGYGPAMEDHVETFVTLVMERVAVHRAQTPDALVMLEQRLDYSRWVPEGFGTGDVVIVSDLGVEVIDLKYGAGVPVSAEGNPQLRLYGLGAYDAYAAIYDLPNVYMTIVQPRLDSISTEQLLAEELLNWAEKVVRTQANLAWEGKGEFVPGDHCRFCRVRSTCRARADANLALAKYDFTPPVELSHSEIADILGRINDLLSWASDVRDYALDQAVNHGVKFDGWKVVEGRSNRKYADEEAVIKLLLEAGFKPDDVTPRQLLGVTALEKLMGKKAFATHLEGLIVKPPGKPVLVPESDKRPELNSAASAADDFAQAI